MSEGVEMSYREKYWWEHYPLHKWWCNGACPLVPRFGYRVGDEYNTSSWNLHWLLIHIWTLDHFSFSVDASICPDSVYVGFILPYLRVTFGVWHTYYEWQYKLSELLRRKPAKGIKND